MGFWDAISNILSSTANELQEAEEQALNEAKYFSKRQLEEKISRCGNSLTELKKKSVYMNELESRK